MLTYGRCLRPALYSSFAPHRATLRVSRPFAIANARKQWALRKSTAKSRRLFRNKSATIRRVRAGANGGSAAMTRTAFCRKPPRIPRVCWRGSWALGTSDRENTNQTNGEGRIKAARCGRSVVGDSGSISSKERTLRISNAHYRFDQAAGAARLSALCGVNDDR